MATRTSSPPGSRSKSTSTSGPAVPVEAVRAPDPGVPATAPTKRSSGRAPPEAGASKRRPAKSRARARSAPPRARAVRTGPGPIARVFLVLGRGVAAVWLGIAHAVGATARSIGHTARDLEPEHRRDGAGLFLFGLAVVVGGRRLVAARRGSVMDFTRTVVDGSVGKVGWFVPLMLVYVGWRNMRDPRAQRSGRSPGRRLGRARLRRPRHRPHRQRQPPAGPGRRQPTSATPAGRSASSSPRCCSTCCARPTSSCRCSPCSPSSACSSSPPRRSTRCPTRLAELRRPDARPPPRGGRGAATRPSRSRPVAAARPTTSTPRWATRRTTARSSTDRELKKRRSASPTPTSWSRTTVRRRGVRPLRGRRARGEGGEDRARAAAAQPAARAGRAARAVRRHHLLPARQRGAQARLGAQGPLEGQRRRRRPAHPGDGGVRHRRAGHRLHPGPDRHPLRGRARPRGQGREGHRALQEHRVRRGLGRRAHPQPDPGQVRDRHRDPERRQGDRLARRRAPVEHRPLRPPPDGGRASARTSRAASSSRTSRRCRTCWSPVRPAPESRRSSTR